MLRPPSESTNMKIWQESGWIITPYNVPAVVVDPPESKELIEPDQDWEEETEDLMDVLETKLRYEKGGLKEFILYRDYREQRLREER